jgi:hypothetical protein
MRNPRCMLCDRPGYEGTGFCRGCLVSAYPPVRAVDVDSGWDPSSLAPRRNSRFLVLAATGLLVGTVVLLVAGILVLAL